MPLKLTTRFNRPATLAMPVREARTSGCALPSVWAAAVAQLLLHCANESEASSSSKWKKGKRMTRDSLGPKHGVESVLGLLVSYTFSVLMTRGPPRALSH